MKNFLILAVIAIVSITFFALNKAQEKPTGSPNLQPTQATPIPAQNEEVNLKASFTIVTNGLTRNFSAKMYHNLSPDVYIESTNPSVVYVKKESTTWDDFFKTLPMQLTKECLITGTKETFCTGQNGTLRFYLNNVEDKNLLDKEVEEGDNALIRFPG